MIASAVRMLDASPRVLTTEDIVLMVYNLGRIDGSLTQLSIDQERSIDRELVQMGVTI
jgi:hypothetical protein